jgi:hypothetical protein
MTVVEVAAHHPDDVVTIAVGQSMLVVPAPSGAFGPALLALGSPAGVNVAHAGEGWLNLADRFAAEMAPLRRRRRATGLDLVLMDGGQGDILNAWPSEPPTAAVAYQRAIDYRDAVLAADTVTPTYFVISTWPMIGPDVLGTGRPSATESARWAEVNALIIANSGGFDAVARCDTAPFDDATDLVYFHPDRTHLTPKGARIKAALLAAAALTIPEVAARLT